MPMTEERQQARTRAISLRNKGLCIVGMSLAVLLLLLDSLGLRGRHVGGEKVEEILILFAPLAAAIVGGLSLDLHRWKPFKVASLFVLTASFLNLGWSWDILGERSKDWEMGSMAVGFAFLISYALMFPPMLLVVFRRTRSIGLLALMTVLLSYAVWWLRRH